MGQMGLTFGYETPASVSYLVDNVFLFRFFEIAGEVRRAISVIKTRRAGHERTIRELHMGPQGIQVSEPLREFQGLPQGHPRLGKDTDLSGRGDG